MSPSFRTVECCPACGSIHGKSFVTRADGISLWRCDICATLYLNRVPIDIAALYTDNYFALFDANARGNVDSRIGYDASYEVGHLDAEFYWAFRLADQIATWLQGPTAGRSCLDVGAATGCLLNVFAAAGYKTHGIELSAPAREIAASHGHTMSQRSPRVEPEQAACFEVVTALEVIEHVEDLEEFFAGIHAVMAERGVFVGYCPSADDTAFSRGADYHWLHSSFEHLLYPSETGIRALLNPLFGENVFVTKFLTRQDDGLIPYCIVVAIKGVVAQSALANVAELFRQLAYLNDRACFDIDASRGAGALAPLWIQAREFAGAEGQLPYVAGVLCAKFGNLEAGQLFLCEGEELERLDGDRLTDLLAIALHGGSIDWLRKHLPAITSRIAMGLIADDCSKVIERYAAEHPEVDVASAGPSMYEGHSE